MRHMTGSQDPPESKADLDRLSHLGPSLASSVIRGHVSLLGYLWTTCIPPAYFHSGFKATVQSQEEYPRQNRNA